MVAWMSVFFTISISGVHKRLSFVIGITYVSIFTSIKEKITDISTKHTSAIWHFLMETKPSLN